MLEDLINERRRKLLQLKQAGIDPYPVSSMRVHTIAQVLKDFSKLTQLKKKISIAGRIMGFRDQGSLLFLDIEDESGSMQGVVKKDVVSNFALFKNTLDRGDFISVTGPTFITKSKQKSVEVRKLTVLSKSLRPLPTQWYGVEDIETRLRKRYIDALLHKTTKELFYKKAIFWGTLRASLIRQGFLEVDTPTLERLPGGAEAEPFKTHHKALDVDFYLRISLELPLKKLLVAGYEKVFEIGRIFRNEGIDAEHLQDYTQLEFYWAYHDYEDLMKLVEKLYKEVVKKTTGSLITNHDGTKIDWSKKWPRINYVEVFEKNNKGVHPITATIGELVARAKELGIEPEAHAGRGRLIDSIFKKTVRKSLVQPCFLINPPVAIEPLAKRHPKNPDVVERFQVVAAGTELGKGFSELNDPTDQRARFEEQAKLREAGDAEAQHLDEDYLEAMEYGMPPAAGFGVSERLFSVIMDRPVRETVIFPLMRPEKE